MATTPARFPPGHTARILAFPLRDGGSVDAAREQKFALMEAVARKLAGVTSASSWYHDEAVAEERDRRH